jgi:pimeloyl-ACP methyl ester carboxylesterase
MLPYLPAAIQRIALGKMYGGSDHVLDSCLRDIVDGLRSPDTLRHVLCILRCWFTERAKLKAALRRVKRIPTLLVWGDRDYTVSLPSAIKLNRKLRASELIVLPGVGHSVFEETPEESNRIILDWLGRRSSIPRLRVRPRAASVARRTMPLTQSRRLSSGS